MRIAKLLAVLAPISGIEAPGAHRPGIEGSGHAVSIATLRPLPPAHHCTAALPVAGVPILAASALGGRLPYSVNHPNSLTSQIGPWKRLRLTAKMLAWPPRPSCPLFGFSG